MCKVLGRAVPSSESEGVHVLHSTRRSILLQVGFDFLILTVPNSDRSLTRALLNKGVHFT